MSDYWKRKGISVDIVSDIAGNPIQKTVQKTEPTLKSKSDDDGLTRELRRILNSNNELVNKVTMLLKQCKNKQELNSLLCKSVKDGKKVSAIHKAAKKYL